MISTVRRGSLCTQDIRMTTFTPPLSVKFTALDTRFVMVLAHAGRIAKYLFRNRTVYVQIQKNRLLRSLHSQGFNYRRDNHMGSDFDVFDLHAAEFDLGQIKHSVYEVQQVLAAGGEWCPRCLRRSVSSFT